MLDRLWAHLRFAQTACSPSGLGHVSLSQRFPLRPTCAARCNMLAHWSVAEVGKPARNRGVVRVTVGLLARSCCRGVKQVPAPEARRESPVTLSLRTPRDGRTAFREPKVRAATNFTRV